MQNSSYQKGGSGLGGQQTRQSYGSLGGGGHSSSKFMGSHGQQNHMEDNRMPKKTQAQPKHKTHGMNQSMDAGIGGEKYHYNSQLLGAGFQGIKPPRGERQSMLGADQQPHNMGHQMVPPQQHQNYINHSYEPNQNQSLSMQQQEIHAKPADYQTNHLIQTMGSQNNSKQNRQKNQSIDVTGNNSMHYQKMQTGIQQANIGNRDRFVQNHQLQYQDMQSQGGGPGQHQMQIQSSGHHQQIQNQQMSSLNLQNQNSMSNASDQEYQRKKRRQNLSQNMQQRGIEPQTGTKNEVTAISRGNTAHSKQENQMIMQQQYNMAISGPHQQKSGKQATNKTQHIGNKSAMGMASMNDHGRMMGSNSALRRSTKFDHLSGGNTSASYGALGNLAGMPEGATANYDQYSQQMIQSQQFTYGGLSNQQTGHREAHAGHASGESQQRLQSVNSQGQSHSLSNQKQGAKLKNKQNNYMINIQQPSQQSHMKSTQSQDRFQSTQVVTKKPVKSSSSKGGSIILPANNTVQIVPQLRQPTKQNNTLSKSLAGNTKGAGSQSQHRMYADESNHINNNIQKGFNSASNATLQQQQQIVQIYQQQPNNLNSSVYNTQVAGSSSKIKYQSNQFGNSRKMLQGGSNNQSQMQQNFYSNGREIQEHQQIMPSHTKSQSQSYMTQPRSKQNGQNQMSLSMQRKLNQQADSSRANNRLQAIGGVNELASQGPYIPISDQSKLSSYMQVDFNSSQMQTGTQGNSVQKKERLMGHQQHQMMNQAQKKEQQLMSSMYKGQHQHSQSIQQPVQNASYDVNGASSGLRSGEISSHNITIDHPSQKFTNQSHVLQSYHKKQGSTTSATNISSGGPQPSSSYKSQSHMRQASLQIGPGGVSVGDMTSSTQKMAANHRKNKSMMNNQSVHVNQNLSNQQQQRTHGQDQQRQVNWNHGTQDPQQQQYTMKRLNHQIDNYRDGQQINDRGRPAQSQSNFYLQFGDSADCGASETANVDSSKSISKKGSQLKQSFNQSSHRKNKTTMIGYSPQKFMGVNSTTGFQRVSGGSNQNIDKAKTAQGINTASKKGGTLSHSQKSLRPTSSQRKRVQSVDPPAVSSQYRGQSQNQNGRDSGSQRRGGAKEAQKLIREQENPLGGASTAVFSTYAKITGGNETPENQNGQQQLADRRSIHQQKAQKIFKNQANIVAKQRLKPQGNIVIQQESSQRNVIANVQVDTNNYMSQGPKSQAQMKLAASRRHQSIIKDDLQNKEMILISEQDYRGSTQKSNQDNLNMRKQGRSQSPRQAKMGQHANIDYNNNQMEQDSAGSMSSQKAMAIIDGGTGGGNTKNSEINQMRQSVAAARGHERHHSAILPPNVMDSSYIDKNTKQMMHRAQQNQQQESEQRDPRIQSNHNSKQRVQSEKNEPRKSNSGKQVETENAPIDFGDITVPQANQAREIANLKKQHHFSSVDSAEKSFLPQMEYNSISITQEALAIGKKPIEQIAEQIYSKKINGQSKLSPRTKEIFDLTNTIKKSFQEKKDAPRTTAHFYRAGKMLGRGAFGKVCLGMHKLSRKLVALKSINKEFMTDEKQKSKVMHEVGILLRLRHQSVVQLYETFETKRHMILSMELCAGGDLLNYVRKRKKLEESEAKVLFKQIIQGLGYIHKRRILHRDIKLDNILLDGIGRVKIADFGVSKLVKPGDTMHEQSGTPAYIAPEILREEGYRGFKADIWSAGVVFFAMLCGTVPFKASNMKELHRMIIKGKYNLKEEISPEAKHLLRSMLETDPVKRISIKKILDHPWFKNYDPNLEIFNQEEKDIVKREFVYNNPKICNRSEKVNTDVEPWDCFTELNLDSVNQTLRNESEKSVILAPFNSSYSDFDEDAFKGMEASLIIHRHFDNQAPLEDKKEMIRFAARCRDQDRQYEINNNGELDNGVYHKFVYSSRDGRAEQSSSHANSANSINDLRPHSSRNLKNRSDSRHVFGKDQGKTEQTQSDGDGMSSEIPLFGDDEEKKLDESRVKCLVRLSFPESYVRSCLLKGEASYCLAAYFLLGDNQQYS